MVPPRRESSGSSRRLCLACARVAAGSCALLAVASCALLAGAGCASGDAPWDVAEGDEARFRRAQRECRLLTENADGSAGPISFDECLNRRGFERMGPIERLWKSG